MNFWSLCTSLLLHLLVVFFILQSSSIKPHTPPEHSSPPIAISIHALNPSLNLEENKSKNHPHSLSREKTLEQRLHPSELSAPAIPSLSFTSDKKTTGLTAEDDDTSQTPSLLSSIRQQINQHLFYPATLRKQGIEGVVQVQFLLDQEGVLIEAKILKSSGHPELDQLAIRALERSSPFSFSNSLQKKMDRIKFILPIQFKITG